MTLDLILKSGNFIYFNYFHHITYKKDAHKETDSLNLQNLKFEINLFLTKSIYTLKNCNNIFSLHNDTKFDLENS